MQRTDTGSVSVDMGGGATAVQLPPSALELAEANEAVARTFGLHGKLQDNKARASLLEFLPFSMDEIRGAAGLPSRNTAEEDG